jgi:hypothetical protein
MVHPLVDIQWLALQGASGKVGDDQFYATVLRSIEFDLQPVDRGVRV